MSLTLNMVGGGGGLSDTDALLRVQAPAGSVVTITKGSLTKTDHGHENADDHTLYDYYFIIHQSQFDSQNAWTVTATLGSDTSSKTVIINAADEYDVTLTYGTLYHAGDTSGWTNLAWKADSNASGAAATIAYNSSDMTITQSAANSSITYHTNSVDLTGYSTLKCTVSSWTSNSTSFNGLYIFSSVSSTSTPYDSAKVARTLKASGTGAQTITVDVSSLSGSYYVGIGTCKTQGINTVAVITGVWLE